MRNRSLAFALLLTITVTLFAQQPQKLNSNQIFEQLQKLNFLGSALYIAAHPDDENTRLLSYLSNHEKARTGYLSLTRGDGGQNLIGPEIRELLGVIRTQELLAARRVDGGEQFFTRANDFGFSKHPDETLDIWDKDKVLHDVVWAIRTFKPDVIINRFNHRTPGSTHGHHTSSAMLSVEAFDLVNNHNAFKEQLNTTSVWQPKRLFFNTSSWFYRNESQFKKETKDKLVTVDVGVYYPLKGLSNNEVAAIASSQHLCQGFGRLTTRGTQDEFLEFLKGDAPKDNTDIFSGINTTWNRVAGGGAIGAILYEIENNFNFINPASHLPKLLEAYAKIDALADEHWRTLKRKQITAIIEACAGLYLEVSTQSPRATPNETISIGVEALNRSSLPITLSAITASTAQTKIDKDMLLAENKRVTFTQKLTVNQTTYSDPYWLRTRASKGMYTVANPLDIGKPETEAPVAITFHLQLMGYTLNITKPIVYRYARGDKGELYEPFEILPKASVKLKEKVLIFSTEEAKTIPVVVTAGATDVKGFVRLQAPKGWQVFPKQIPVQIALKGDEQTVEFTVTPPANASEGVLAASVQLGTTNYTKELVTIAYDHIPKQSVLVPAEAKIVRLNIQKSGQYIGYIKGAGDAIPESLTQIGYTVVVLDPAEINAEELTKFDAIVMGIRAYNTVPELKFKQAALLDYVKNGGTMITQYNTSRGVDVGAPFDLSLSRDRVTNEEAPVRILAQEHPLLNYPNKITANDFKGWVQERGLYFPNQWSTEYTPIISMNDKGESPKNGSLLIAKYGKGNYIYTGLSFFRELPAGVSGAYKLFANMLSVGKASVPSTPKLKN